MTLTQISDRSRLRALVALSALAGATACGRVSGPGGAGDDDDGTDGGDDQVDAAPPGEVTIRVFANGTRAPLLDVPVVFVGPDGAEIATVHTDQSGSATQVVPPHSVAIALLVNPNDANAHDGVAVLDVNPGDDIRVGGEYYPTGDPTSTMTISLEVIAGASYMVQTPCGAFYGGNLITIGFHPGCEPDDFAILAMAFPQEGGIRTIVQPDVERVDGGAVTLRNFRAVTPETVTLSGIPVDVSYVSGLYAAGRARGGSFDTDNLGSGSLDLTQPEPGDSFQVGSIDQLDAGMFSLELYNQQQNVGRQRLSFLRGPIGEDFTVAVDEHVMPWISPPLMDFDRRRFSWAQTGDQPWDATYVNYYWQISGQEATQYGTWQIVAPPGVSSIELPELPEELAGWLPTAPTYSNAAVTLMESSEFADWDSARRAGVDPLRYDYIVDAMDVPSTLRTSYASTNGCVRRGPGGAQVCLTASP